MDTEMVMTIIGPDRPGIVELLARIINQHDGNWLESRMSHLGGQFAGILRIQVPESRKEALHEALTSLQEQNLVIIVRYEPVEAEPVPLISADLELVGHDKPGIIREISQILSVHSVNVEELHTDRTSAPMCGEPLFTAHARLRVPHPESVALLRAALEELAANLMVDISLDETEASKPQTEGALG